MEVTLELSDPVVMQQNMQCLIYFIKNLAIRRPVTKTLIKYNKNLEENEEEKEPINIELTEQKKDPYNDENAIDFKWSDAKEEDEKDIALAYFIESLQK